MREFPHRAVVHFQAPAGSGLRQFGHQTAQRERRCHPAAQPIRLRPPDLQGNMPTDLARGRTPQPPPALRPFHDTGRCNAQRVRHLPHRLAKIKPRHRAIPDIHRKRSGHESWPPHPSSHVESEIHPTGNPPRFKQTSFRSSCELSSGCPFGADREDWSYHTSVFQERPE